VEEMAHAIYVEWFVRFHFPGHETVQMVESGTELGRIPHGWEAVPFSEAVKVNPKIDVDRAAIKPYVSMSGISTSSMVIECDEYRSGSSGSKFQNDDVIFPRITPSVEHGKGAYVQFLDGGQVGLGSTEFIVFRPDRLPSQYIYFLSREYAFRENAIKSMVGASGRQRVRMECFDSFLVAMPSPELLSMYSDLTRPHFRYIHSLNLSRSRIQGARDLLLPKLVSCEVELVSI
jgi:type I restriction enzyme S subunit